MRSFAAAIFATALGLAGVGCGDSSPSSDAGPDSTDAGPGSARACCIDQVGDDAGSTACRSTGEHQTFRRCRGNRGCTALDAPTCGCDCHVCWDERCVLWRRTECASGGGGSGPCPPE